MAFLYYFQGRNKQQANANRGTCLGKNLECNFFSRSRKRKHYLWVNKYMYDRRVSFTDIASARFFVRLQPWFSRFTLLFMPDQDITGTFFFISFASKTIILPLSLFVHLSKWVQIYWNSSPVYVLSFQALYHLLQYSNTRSSVWSKLVQIGPKLRNKVERRSQHGPCLRQKEQYALNGT